MPTTLFDAAPNVITKRAGEFQHTKLDRWPFAKRSGAMRTEGQLWMPTWKDLSKFEYPTRGYFDTQRPNNGKSIDHKTVIDSTAEDAIDVLMAGMSSGLTSPSRPWKKLELGIPELERRPEVKYWLDTVNKNMDDVFQRSNFYGAMEMMYGELATFGTACCFMEEDYDDVIKCRVFTIGEYYLGCDSKGRVNAFHRQFWMTAGQMVERFGKENCSDSVKVAVDGHSPDQWFQVNILLEVNDDRLEFIKDYKNMPFRCVYWENGAAGDSYLRLGGYEEFPVIAPRWARVTTADVYGRGPGWKALGDVKMLQRMQKEKLIALSKVVNPPVQVDASVSGEVNTLPGGVTKFSNLMPNGGMRSAYDVRPDIGDIDLSIEKTRDAIKKKFMTDLFLMMIEAERAGTPVTATEIMEKQSEKVSRLGPVLEANKDELHTPAIDRAYGIMQRGGLLPPVPPIIAEMDISVKYISILHQAQRMLQLHPTLQWVGVGGQLAQAGHEEALDKIDADEIMNNAAEMLGIPPKQNVSDEKVAVIRKQRAEAQEQAVQAQQMLASSEAAAKGGKAVKDLAGAEMGKGNALDGVLASLSGRQ
jgi:hypothetical protein